MSVEVLAVGIALAGLLVTLGVLTARAASRLAVVEVLLGTLATDVKQLRDTWLTLSAARARHSRETEEIDL